MKGKNETSTWDLKTFPIKCNVNVHLNQFVNFCFFDWMLDIFSLENKKNCFHWEINHEILIYNEYLQLNYRNIFYAH